MPHQAPDFKEMNFSVLHKFEDSFKRDCFLALLYIICPYRLSIFCRNCRNFWNRLFHFRWS